MVVELISVGTELLLGNIVNTNARYLSEKCAMLGLAVYYQTTVGDNRERMAGVIKTALDRADMIILNGGLGPTAADITKEVCAEVMGARLVEDPTVKAHLEEWYKLRMKSELPESNWGQALVPEGAVIFENHNGTAPGLAVEKDGKIAILLPGPPGEMYPMFEEQVCPYIQGKQSGIIRSQMIKICGFGESKVEEMLLDLIDSQTNPTIATYAKTKEVHIRVTARAETDEEAKKILKPVVKEIKKRFGNAVYTTDENETLEDVVVRLLTKYDLTVTTAESCTGGLLAGRLVNVPGASEVFRQGFITYSNKAKRKQLDVSKTTLRKYGAVSEQTAKEMATGGVFATDADICIAVTGVAGPDGGTPEKPVGLVYIACYMKDSVQVEEYHFNGNREKVREQTVVQALDLLRRSVLSHYKKD